MSVARPCAFVESLFFSDIQAVLNLSSIFKYGEPTSAKGARPS